MPALSRKPIVRFEKVTVFKDDKGHWVYLCPWHRMHFGVPPGPQPWSLVLRFALYHSAHCPLKGIRNG